MSVSAYSAVAGIVWAERHQSSAFSQNLPPGDAAVGCGHVYQQLLFPILGPVERETPFVQAEVYPQQEHSLKK